MNLCLRPIASGLPVPIEPVTPADITPEESDAWRDSSIDLQRGLDVIELPADIPTVEEETLR